MRIVSLEDHVTYLPYSSPFFRVSRTYLYDVACYIRSRMLRIYTYQALVRSLRNVKCLLRVLLLVSPRALLFLLPEEVGFLRYLRAAKVRTVFSQFVSSLKLLRSHVCESSISSFPDFDHTRGNSTSCMF